MRLIYLLIGLSCMLSSCNSDNSKKTETPISNTDTLSKDAKIALGKRLFSEKTCKTCHLIDKNSTGPSIKTIVEVYKDENESIVDFLRGQSKPIVDTRPVQVAMMKANINGFLKQVTDAELDAIATYMLHVDARND